MGRTDEQRRVELRRIVVVVPAHDAQRTLAACVESALSGTRAPTAVVVVDDASSDHTPKVALTLAQTHPAVRVVQLPQNRGPASARNAGAAAAREADAFFFLDADTELDPDALARFAARLEEADAVCGIYAPVPLNAGLAARYKALLDHFHFARRGVVAYDGFTGSCGGVRAGAFEAVGGFDETLRAGDDYENELFGYRLSAAGLRTVLDPEIRARHHFPALGKLTQTYFVRVSQWTRLFAARGRFESAGDATAGTGLATLAVPLMLASIPFALGWPPGWLGTGALGALWLRGYAPFFAFVAKHDVRDLPGCVALNIWCSTVISAGAAHGLLLHLVRSALGVRGSNPEASHG
jgi:GT2 family glycosyltransferase